MVLYTPLVEQDIFPSEEENQTKFVSYEGRMVQVSSLQSGQYRIEQLISTNPTDYLNESYLPGTIIRY